MTITPSQLQEIKKSVGNKKLKRPKKWLFPMSLERRYKKLLKWLVRQIRGLVNEQLKPKIPTFLQEVEETYPNNDSVKIDSFIDDFQNVMRSIEQSLKPFVDYAKFEAEEIGSEIAEYNKVQFQKVNNSVFGIDIFIDEPYLRDQLELFASQNSTLIESLTDDTLSEVSGIVERGLVEGSRFTEVSRDLQKRFGISRRRADLIARDQTSKLNSSLTRLRQQSVGADTYRWQTSNDERVRESHRMMSGKVCSWEDPTIWLNEQTGKWEKRPQSASQAHVGYDINCRCVGLVRIEGLID